MFEKRYDRMAKVSKALFNAAQKQELNELEMGIVLANAVALFFTAIPCDHEEQLKGVDIMAGDIKTIMGRIQSGEAPDYDAEDKPQETVQ